MSRERQPGEREREREPRRHHTTMPAVSTPARGGQAQPISSRLPAVAPGGGAYDQRISRRGPCRLRFVSPVNAGPEAMRSVSEVFGRVLGPLYGPQDSAVDKIRAARDRACRVAFDPSDDPSMARGMIVFKTAPSDEYARYGLRNSFEVKTLLVMNAAGSDDTDENGYGSDMLWYALEKAGLVKASSLHITVSEEAPTSLAFFVRRGFRLVHAWKGLYKEGKREFLLARNLEGGRPPRPAAPRRTKRAAVPKRKICPASTAEGAPEARASAGRSHEKPSSGPAAAEAPASDHQRGSQDSGCNGEDNTPVAEDEVQSAFKRFHGDGAGTQFQAPVAPAPLRPSAHRVAPMPVHPGCLSLVQRQLAAQQYATLLRLFAQQQASNTMYPAPRV